MSVSQKFTQVNVSVFEFFTKSPTLKLNSYKVLHLTRNFARWDVNKKRCKSPNERDEAAIKEKLSTLKQELIDLKKKKKEDTGLYLWILYPNRIVNYFSKIFFLWKIFAIFKVSIIGNQGCSKLYSPLIGFKASSLSLKAVKFASASSNSFWSFIFSKFFNTEESGQR